MVLRFGRLYCREYAFVPGLGLRKGDEMRKIQKIPQDEIPSLEGSNAPVRLMQAGNVLRVTQYEKEPKLPPIRKLNKDLYEYTVDIKDAFTGEVIHVQGEVAEFRHTVSRADDKREVSRSLAKLRNLINANVTDVANMRWVTLTYRENMTDIKRLYDDFKKFNMRFVYYLKAHDIEKPEYIAVVEPQGRGAWHMHVLYIWDGPAPFIDNNSVFAPMWRHGFTKIKALRGDIDNLGAYLSAYLGDMSLDEYVTLSDSERISLVREGCDVMEREVEDASGKRVKKKILKGARLRLYPPGTNIFRASRGVKRPVEEYVSLVEAKRKVGSGKPTFQTALRICDVSEKTGKLVKQNTIVKTYYNVKRADCQVISAQSEEIKQDVRKFRCGVCGSVFPESDFASIGPDVSDCICRECAYEAIPYQDMRRAVSGPLSPLSENPDVPFDF